MPVNIRIAADTAYRRASLLDSRTKEPIFFYTGSSLVIEIGLFAGGVVADISLLDTLNVQIKAVGSTSSDPAEVEAQLTSVDLDDTLTDADWEAGSAHCTVSIPAAETVVSAGNKLFTIWSTDSNGDIVTWLSGTIVAVEDAGGLTTTAPDLVNQYYSAATSDARFADVNLLKVPNEKVLLRHLAQEIISSMSGGLDPAKYLGEVTSLSQDLVDPTLNIGKWYFVRGVDGSMTGTHAPTDPVEDGSYLMTGADGTAGWQVRGPAPTIVPAGGWLRTELESPLQQAIPPEGSVVDEYDRPDYAFAVKDKNGNLLTGLPPASDMPKLISRLRDWAADGYTANPAAYAGYDRPDLEYVMLDSAGRILERTPAASTSTTSETVTETVITKAETAFWIDPGAQLAVTKTNNPQDIIDLWDAVISGATLSVGASPWGVKSNIGTSSDGAYSIYKYVFEPESYEKTIILSAAIHGIEKYAAYLLPRIFTYIRDNWPASPILEFLRFRVRWIILPVVSPWSFANNERRVWETAAIPCTWTRSGTTVTVTIPTGGSFPSANPSVSAEGYINDSADGKLDVWVSSTSDGTAVANGVYRVQTTPTAQTFTITGANAGATSGTLNLRVFTDPNRNWNAGNWLTHTASVSFVDADGGAYDNKGTSPNSLNETAVLKAVLDEYATADAFLSFHNGPSWPYPVYYPSTHDTTKALNPIVERFKHLVADALNVENTGLLPTASGYAEESGIPAVEPEWKGIPDLSAADAEAAALWYANFISGYARLT